MQRPLVLSTICFATGILLAQRLSLPLGLLYLGIICGLGVTFFTSLKGKRASNYLLLAVALLVGILWMEIHLLQTSRLISYAGSVQVVTGTITGEPREYDGRVVFTLKAQALGKEDKQLSPAEPVLVTVFRRGETEQYHYGQLVQILGKVELPPTRRNPGEFDYRAYLKRRGIAVQILTEPKNILVLGRTIPNVFFYGALEAKSKINELIDSSLLPEQGAVLKGILFGDKTGFSSTQKDLFARLGVMHLFAVSGLHVGFVLLFFMAIASLAGLSPRNGALLAGGGIIFYALVTGLSPSVVRATIMAWTILLAKLVYREYDFYSSLALAALILLVTNPFNLFEAGFQLSFVVTWGLVYLTPVLQELFTFMPRWRAFFFVPLAAQLASLPLTMYYFNLFPLLAIPINLVLTGLAGIIVNLGLVAFLLTYIAPGVATLLLRVDGVLIQFVLHGLRWAGSIPPVALTVATPHIYWIMAYFLLLILAGQLWKRRCGKQKHLSFLLVLVLLLIVIGVHGRNVSGELRVTFLDVGQGDAVFIYTPQGKTILVDGGGLPRHVGSEENTVGDKIVVPFLERQGLRRVDVIITTHPHQDHLQGLAAVLARFPVGLAIYPQGLEDEPDYSHFFEILTKKGVHKVACKEGDRINVDSQVLMEVLHPPVNGGQELDINNRSLVLRISYGQISFLLTGDIETDAMQFMLDQHLTSTVYKAPHHGSRKGLNPHFLNRVNPKIVVISVGQDNSFGHPAPQLLQYWQRRLIPVYRTDQNGAVLFSTDGKNLRVSTVLP